MVFFCFILGRGPGVALKMMEVYNGTYIAFEWMIFLVVSYGLEHGLYQLFMVIFWDGLFYSH